MHKRPMNNQEILDTVTPSEKSDLKQKQSSNHLKVRLRNLSLINSPGFKSKLPHCGNSNFLSLGDKNRHIMKQEA